MRGTAPIILAALAAIAAGCSSSKDAAQERWSITAGMSGGFTGMANGFTMLETGDVYVWSGMKGRHELTYKVGAVSPELAREFKARLDSARVDTMTLNAPGNMSSYIELETSAHTDRITWGAPEHRNPPPQLRQWYDDFLKTCKTLEQ